MSFPVAGRDRDRAERLWSVYSLERAADQSTTPVSFALATVGITYMATTLAIVMNLDHQLHALVAVLLPLAPLGVFRALIVIDATSQARGMYLDELEKELNLLHRADLQAAGFDVTHPPSLPAPAWRHLTRPLYRESDPPSKIRQALVLALHPYVLAGSFVLLYSTYVLVIHQRAQVPHVAALVCYILLMGVNFYSVLVAKTPARYAALRALRDESLYRGTQWRQPPSLS